MSFKKILSLTLALLLALGTLALAESDDLQAQLDAANARIAELEAQVEKYQPVYESQVVAEYGDGEVILLQEAKPQYQSVAQMYAQYGISLTNYGDSIKQSVLSGMVQQAVVEAKEVELGLDQLDEATLADLEALADEDMETYLGYYGSYFATEGATDEENRAAAISGLAEAGYSKEALLEQRVRSYVDEQLVDSVTGDITVTEDEVKAEYDRLLEEAKATFAESDYDYNSARTSGGTIVWNPEGYRAVKHVLIQFDDEQDSRYSDLSVDLEYLQDELDMLSDPEAQADAKAAAEENGEEFVMRSAEEIEADMGKKGAALEALYAELLPTAQEVIDAFNNGTDFDTLIDEYGDDPGMDEEPAATLGYAVSENSDYWEEAFVKGAMAIPEVGGISEPIRGTNGIHIIYYMADITPGEVPYEEVHDELETSTLENKKSTAYNDQVKAWVADANPVYHIDRFI